MDKITANYRYQKAYKHLQYYQEENVLAMEKNLGTNKCSLPPSNHLIKKRSPSPHNIRTEPSHSPAQNQSIKHVKTDRQPL